MFDRDEHPDIDHLIEAAERSGVRVAFSHPCFELWLLLHFRQHGAPAAGDGKIICKLLRDHLNSGKHVDLANLKVRYAAARERARSRSEQHARDGALLPTQRDPSTNVWELVDRLGITYQ